MTDDMRWHKARVDARLKVTLEVLAGSADEARALVVSAQQDPAVWSFVVSGWDVLDVEEE